MDVSIFAFFTKDSRGVLSCLAGYYSKERKAHLKQTYVPVSTHKQSQKGLDNVRTGATRICDEYLDILQKCVVDVKKHLSKLIKGTIPVDKALFAGSKGTCIRPRSSAPAIQPAAAFMCCLRDYYAEHHPTMTVGEFRTGLYLVQKDMHTHGMIDLFGGHKNLYNYAKRASTDYANTVLRPYMNKDRVLKFLKWSQSDNRGMFKSTFDDLSVYLDEQRKLTDVPEVEEGGEALSKILRSRLSSLFRWYVLI